MNKLDQQPAIDWDSEEVRFDFSRNLDEILKLLERDNTWLAVRAELATQLIESLREEENKIKLDADRAERIR